MIFGVSRMFGVTKIIIYIVRLPILSPPLQVISLRDQIKRRQQGVDSGKDVREGFMCVGSSCFCVCVSIQKVHRKVDVSVTWRVSVILTLNLFQLHPKLILILFLHRFLSHRHHSSDYLMVPPLAWRIVS